MSRWTCPNCLRSLSRPNIWHQCVRKPVEAVFERSKPEVFDIYTELQKKLSLWNEVAYSATKNCIVYVGSGTFLVIRPMKSALDLKFYLQEETDEFPVYKITRWGKRIEHHIRLFEMADLDDSVISLLYRAYTEDHETNAP